MQDVMLFQPTLPMLASVFQLLKHIKLNMLEEHVVTFTFNKNNLNSSSTSFNQQPHGQLNKVMPQNTKGTKL
jgi:hypothetical protein